ncbi:MAG: glycosyltransferase family 9 protein [Thiohalocapsa sp.]
MRPPPRPTAADFPAGTPLRHFFAWNERRWRRDRRYRAMRTPGSLPPEAAAALDHTIGNRDVAAHAAVFRAFEAMRPPPRRVLVIRLSAFGDMVQALGPFAAIRRHHPDAYISLLTTAPYVAFATELGCFDEVIVDERPPPPALDGWLRLRRRLRQLRIDRVYDLQTSHRSGVYAALLWPLKPEWSGIAWGCSHPHANRARDAQHTLDKQAEQLLMAGIHPTPPPILPPIGRPLPPPLQGRRFALLAPGSSPRHPEKRWAAARFGTLAQALKDGGVLPVVVGVAAEAPLAAAISAICPAAVDLVGRTDLTQLAALTTHAALAVGNDTGLCHLAAAAGIPVIVLFSRASDPVRHAPRGSLVRVLAAPDLADLPAETVIAAAADILAAGPSRQPSPRKRGEGECGTASQIRSLSPLAGRGTG